MKITNWGKYPVQEGELRHWQADKGRPTADSQWIPRGMGRCYGDSSLSPLMLSGLKMDRFLAFDETEGLLTCESGVTYEDLLTHFVPKGWFPPVTPGTKFVSLGGAIASDVHGKNHHKEGSINQYVREIRLLTAQGEVLRCSRTERPEVFWATFGGMGLTGLVLSLTMQLKAIETSAIQGEWVKGRNLQESLEIFEANEDTTYTMAWIDCLSRGNNLGRTIVMKGEHASLEEVKGSRWEKDPLEVPTTKKLTVPFDFPTFVLNRFSVQAFNFLYYHKQFKRVKRGLQSYEPFFYPLDSIHHWNRIFGKRGFTQYQLVVPKEAALTALPQVLKRLRETGFGSFLSVLKLMGPETQMMSFPMVGYTLTMDFPITDQLFPFLEELDRIVVDHGGRIYLTKDVRLPADTLPKMYPNLPQFQQVVQQLDPEGRLQSLQSARLNLRGDQISTPDLQSTHG
ncbi:MAG: FAD-binding oxidoreductase [Bacteroidota bacterium]